MASLTLDWVQFASAVGALQGLLLSGVLVSQRRNRTANRLLAALIATFTIYLGGFVYYGAGLVRVFPHLFALPYAMPWLFGPLVYLYAVAASDRSWRFTTRTLIHLALPAFVFLLTLPSYFLSTADKLALLDRLISGDTPRRLMLIDPTKYLSGISYTVATVLCLRQHRREIEHNYSNTRRVSLNWLLFLTGAAIFIWLLATTLSVFDPGAYLSENDISLAMALLVYAIGYMGLRQPEVFRYETAEHAVPRGLLAAVPSSPVLQPADEQLLQPAAGFSLQPAAEPSWQAADEIARPARYERSGLGDVEAEQLKASLLGVMDRDRPWRNSELTLADLSARLESTPHKLSEVLNGQLNQTFYDFVNGYRVREVQRRIRAGDARTLKLLALAMDAGFASKSTFNQAFKKHTNQTPSEFGRDIGRSPVVEQ